MSLIEIIRTVILNIKENKFRVFLTSLGIIVGTFTIIIVVGISKGSSDAINEQFASLSAKTIMVRGSMGRGQSSSVKLNFDDANILKEASAVEDVGVSINGMASVSIGTETTNHSIVGVNESYMSINNFNLECGEAISDIDSQKRKKVAVIGHSMAEDMSEDVSNVIGEKIIIKGKRYEVIGVLESDGDTSGFGGTNETVLLPYEVAQNYVVGKKGSPMFNVQAKDINSVDLAMEQIEDILEDEKGDISNISIMDAGNKLESAKESEKTMSALLVGVAVIVLVVGGIGIMNVLLVSVKERTKEIGILKSIGATKRDILLEFLLESITISVIAGLVGSLLSVLFVPIMQYTDLKFTPSLGGILIGIIFSVAVGTFFGYYPALKASELKPIDALNYE